MGLCGDGVPLFVIGLTVNFVLINVILTRARQTKRLDVDVCGSPNLLQRHPFAAQHVFVG